MGRKLTQEEVVNRIFEEVGDEYTMIGVYVNANASLKMRHNHCCHPDGFYEFDTTYHRFVDGHQRCPCESNQIKITTKMFLERLAKERPTLSCDDEYINSHTPMNIHCKICKNIFPRTPDNIFNDNIAPCPCCNGSNINYVIIGYNDIWTTHPHIAELLEDKEFGYTHSYGTKEKTYFRCPDCNNRLYTLPSLLYNKANEIVCPQCKDGFSYPEKFMCSVLNQLGISYIYQLTSRDYEWVGEYRYDFYLDEYNYIIETHGLQHYDKPMGHFKNGKSQKEIDEIKKYLALINGINKYLEIDCRYSELEWIKNSILNSELNVLFDLSVIDWAKCALYASKSLLVSVCNAWNDGNDTIKGLQEQFGLSDITIARYLDKGTEIGLCSFNHTEYVSRIRSENWKKCKGLLSLCKSVYCHELNEVLPSMAEARRKYNAHNLDEVCGNPNRTSGGYHWSFVSQLSEEFKKLNNIK